MCGLRAISEAFALTVRQAAAAWRRNRTAIFDDYAQ